MSLKRNVFTGEVREISDDRIAAWISAGNLKGQHYSTEWEIYTPPPIEPELSSWRVSKDTIISRVTAANALPLVMSALASQSAEQQFVFAQSAWFWSDNATLRGMCAALGLDADSILAPDPYL